MKYRTIQARVSPKEEAAIDGYIERLNAEGIKINGREISRSNLTRALLLTACGDKLFLVNNKAYSDLEESIGQLRGIASNLNQLAKAYNEGKIVHPINGESFFQKLILASREHWRAVSEVLIHLSTERKLLQDRLRINKKYPFEF